MWRSARAKRAEEDALVADAFRVKPEEMQRLDEETGYHPFGMEQMLGQWVCARCSAVISSRERHDAWHESLVTEQTLDEMVDALARS